MFLRKLSVNLVIISLVFTLACPFIGTRYSFAENSPEGWEDLTNTSELVDAFRYYCKSRDLTIDGTVPGMVTEFTTDVFNGLCVATGINITQLQAELKKTFDNNGAVQYLFTRTGVTAYNRLFAQFLQDNQLQTGDTVDNKQIYSGRYFQDDNGHGCLVYIINRSTTTAGSHAQQDKSLITQYGTPLISADTLFSEIPLNTYKNYSFTVNGVTYTGDLSYLGDDSNGLGISHMVNQNFFNGNDYLTAYDVYWPNNVTNTALNGCISVFKFNNAYLLGVIGINAGWGSVNTSQFNIRGVVLQSFGSTNMQSGNVYINAPTTINNNVYEGDTIINNNGDVINNNPDPDPDPDPDQDNWDYPDIPSSDTYPGQPGSGINWPSLDLPDIDLDSPGTWSLGNITEKFPFSIPFDLVALLTVLNHEPVTPDFTSDIQIGSICNWHIDADLEQFDGIATLIRTFEFIGFCIGLLYFTVHIVKG